MYHYYPKAFTLLTIVFFSMTLYSQQQGPEKWTAKVYPNPSDGIIHVELSGKFDELTHINIVDATGKSVYWKNVSNDQTHKIDLTSIRKGHYVVQMMSTNVYMKQPLVIN